MAHNQEDPQTINQSDSGPGAESEQPEPRTGMSPDDLLDKIDFEQYIVQDMNTDIEFAPPDTTESGLELAFMKLTAQPEFSNTRLPLDSTLGDIPVHTFGQLLVELKAKYQILSHADYLDYFKQAHSITATTFGLAVEQSMQALIGFEDLGCTYIAGFKEYSETDEYQERFPEYQEARDWARRNKLSGEAAKQQVPSRYPRYGSALLACYSSQYWHRTLKTLTNKFPKEEEGIGALNRAILNRVQKSKKSKHGRKGQKATISLSTVDLEQALKLAGQHWSIPSPEEITAENLFIDRVLGTLTSVPENLQSYAETMASESIAPTPQQPSRYISPVSRPPPLDRQNTPNNACSESPPGHRARHETPAPRTPIAALGTSRSGSRQGTQFTPVNQRLPSSLPPSPTPPCATTNTSNQREPLASHMAEQPPAPLKSGHEARDETPVPASPTTIASSSTPESPRTAPSTSGHGPQDNMPPLVRLDEAPTAGSQVGVTDEEILGEEDSHAEKEPCLCLTSSIFDQALLSQIEAEANKRRPLGWTTERARQARVNFLRKLAKPLTEAEQQNSQICSQHLDKIRRATGLSRRVGNPELVHRLAALASNCDSVESWDDYTHRDAQRSLWLSAPVFEHNLFGQFHYHTTSIPLKMPVSNDGWDFLISDLMKHVPSLTDDPRSLLASQGYVDINLTNPYLQTPEMQHLLALETRIIDHHTTATGGVRWARQHSIAQQIMVQDIGRYYLDVLLRPDHPHNLIAYPQPAIDTRTLDKDEAPVPFHVPLSMHRPFVFKNSLTSFVPLVAEDKQGCDHFLYGAGGTIQAFDEFCEVYAQYLDRRGGGLPFRFDHHIDAEGLAHARPEAFSIYPVPLPSTSHVRFMVPWMPRASRGNGPRLVLQPTLVVPRDALPTDQDFTGITACDTRVDGGVHFEDVQHHNTQMTACSIGPWGACHPLRKLPTWSAWRSVHGVNKLSDAITGQRDHHDPEVIIIKNILFSTDPTKANLRWELIERSHRAAAEAAKRAIQDFIQAEAALFPENGFSGGSPRPRPEKEWVTLTDEEAIKQFVIPRVDNIHQEDEDSCWIPSEDERVSEEDSASDVEDEAQGVIPDQKESGSKRKSSVSPSETPTETQSEDIPGDQSNRARKRRRTRNEDNSTFSASDTYSINSWNPR